LSGGEEIWENIEILSVSLTKGVNKVGVKVRNGGFQMKSLEFYK
jgi:hypothetical protein